MNTEEFSIFFVLQASSFSKTGYFYNQQVSLLDPARFVEDIEQRRDYFAGGYCFVNDTRIWNTKGKVRYNANEAYCDVDDLSYALMFLRSVVDYLPVDRAIDCSLLEMIVVKARYENERTLSLIGEAGNGSVVYEKFTVGASVFFKELRGATEEYIRFAQALSECINRAESLRTRTRHILLRKLHLLEWLAVADRLSRIVSDIITT